MSKFRWAAEFLAGPGGFLEKEEIVSDWYPSLAAARESAERDAERQVEQFPMSRGRVLKLIVEDDGGKVVELKNAVKTKVYRDY